MTAPLPSASNSTSPRAMITLALGLVAIVFAAGLGGGFVFDDFPNLVDNPQLRELSWAALGDHGSSVLFSSQSSQLSRPLAMASFMLDRLLFDWHPLGWKLHSLMWHLLNTCLVFGVARQWLAWDAPTRDVQTPAFLLALAWATLPIHVSSVLYVVQRMELMAATFVLLALLAYGHGRQRLRSGEGGGWAWMVGAGGLAAIGLLAKESAASFFPCILALEGLLFRFECALRRDAQWLRLLAGLGAFGALLAAVLLAPHYFRPEAFAVRDHDAAERLMGQPRAIWQYIEWILLPRASTMVFYYDDWPTSRSWLSPPTTVVATLALSALVAGMWAVRRRWPLVAAGVGLFLAGHLLTSSYLPLEHVFEHRNYLPALGLLAATAGALLALPQHAGRLLPWLVGGWLALSAGQAMVRASHWGSPFRFAEWHASQATTSPRACYDRAMMYIVASGFDPSHPAFEAADRELLRCTALPGVSLLPAQAGILLHARGGTGNEARWWDLLEAGLHDPISPSSATALIALARCRIEDRCRVDDDRLRKIADRTASLSSTDAEVDRAMGDLQWKVFASMGHAEEAYRRGMAREGSKGYTTGFALTALMIQQCRGTEANVLIDSLATRSLSRQDRELINVMRNALGRCENRRGKRATPSINSPKHDE